MKKGRPKQTGSDCLHDRILEALTQPHTLGGLVTLLEANRKTLYSQLKRMTEAGEVVKQERGLYALPASQDTTETCIDRVEQPAEPITLEGIEDGVLEYVEANAEDYRDEHTEEFEEFPCSIPNMGTAEPKWAQSYR